ncbi:MAG: hypothetical protein J1F32_00695 [Erysipelotrichales bacterium]|nr:hypothetical protein [Erysipelotrichales bacterium]
MNEILNEMFLSEYFLYEYILKSYVKDKDYLFDKLADVYMIPLETRKELKNTCFNQTVQGIKNYNEYMQYCRTQSLYGAVLIISDPVKRMVQIKGNAIKNAPVECEKITKATILNRLYDNANSGDITSMRILGFIECEGIYLNKCLERGYSNIEKAAKWNDIKSILMAIYYNADERELNMQRLFSVAQKTIYEDVISVAEDVYKTKIKRVVLPECKLIKMIFEQHSGIKADLYNPQYARLIYSNVISESKKNRLISFPKSENIAGFFDLPLDLAFSPTCVNYNAAKFCLDNREEVKDIISYLDLIRLGGKQNLRPLCISSDSKYALKLFKRYLSNCFTNTNFEDIDIQDLSGYDIEPTKENIFLRRCNEEKNNVYFLTFNGEIEQDKFEKVVTFLKNGKRNKFLIVNLSAEVNLDAIIPICFCDKTNAQNLKKYCDIIEVSPFSNMEKNALIEDLINTQKDSYKLNNIEIDDEVKHALLNRSLDDIKQFIDKSILHGSKNNGNIRIDLDTYKSIISKEIKSSKTYGFEVK